MHVGITPVNEAIIDPCATIAQSTRPSFKGFVSTNMSPLPIITAIYEPTKDTRYDSVGLNFVNSNSFPNKCWVAESDVEVINNLLSHTIYGLVDTEMEMSLMEEYRDLCVSLKSRVIPDLAPSYNFPGIIYKLMWINNQIK